MYAIIAVNNGADDLTVSENETAVYLSAITEHIIAPHLWDKTES